MTTPYQNTKMSVAESKLQIENLLHENGGMSYQWFEVSQRLALIFSLETRGKKRVVRLVPSILVTTGVPLWPATYRLLYWGLRPRLQAIKAGADIDHEFMPDIVVSDREKGGKTTTIGQNFSADMLSGKITPVTQGNNFVALPANALVEVDKNGRIIPF